MNAKFMKNRNRNWKQKRNRNQHIIERENHLRFQITDNSLYLSARFLQKETQNLSIDIQYIQFKP